MSTEKMSFAEFLNSIEPFTVGQMREAIAGLADDTQILFGIPADLDTKSDWFNVAKGYKRPDATESNYMALTFFLNDKYDSRQF